MRNRSVEENYWFFYVVECSDKTFYAGITTNLDRRIKEHNEGKGAE